VGRSTRRAFQGRIREDWQNRRGSRGADRVASLADSPETAHGIPHACGCAGNRDAGHSAEIVTVLLRALGAP